MDGLPVTRPICGCPGAGQPGIGTGVVPDSAVPGRAEGGAEAMASTLAHGSHPTPGGSPFPPIAEYGFISDCEVSALVAPSGNVEWLCLPRMDGPSVFAAMLDRDAGWFRLGPADLDVPAGRRYLPGTMVLETTWDAPTGWAVVRDVLLIGPWRHEELAVGDPPAGPGRSQRRAGATAHGPVPQRVDRLRAGMRAGVRLWPAARHLASSGQRLRRGRGRASR